MNKQFANRDVSNLVIERLNSNGTAEPYAFIDYANVTAVDMTGEVVHAYGGQGHPKKVTFTGDRGGTLRVESQIGDGLLYSMLTGADIEESAPFLKRAVVAITAASSSTTYYTLTFTLPTPAYNRKDGIMGVYLPAGNTYDELDLPLSGTANTYNVTTRQVSYRTSDKSHEFSTGDLLVVYYQEELSDIIKLNLKSTTFPSAVRICGQTWDKDADGHVIEEHMVAYKAVPQPTFTISNQNTGDPGTITITFDLLEDSNKNMFDLVFVDENE